MAGSFEEAVKYGLGTYMYIYSDATAADKNKATGGIGYSTINGTTYLATNSPIKGLESKLLLREDATPVATNTPIVSPVTPVVDDTQESYVNNLPVGNVAIKGKTVEGQSLFATAKITDDDGLGDISYQWFSNGAEIKNNATFSEYKLTTDDIGKKISVKASYIDGEGTTEVVASPNTPVIKSSKPVVSNVPTDKNDVLTGTDKNDTISALAGNDTITGGLSADSLTGGAGADVFKYISADDTGITSKTRDTITDFNTKDGDKIDLSSIDSNIALANDQAFTFIGNAPFSKTDATGQLRFDSVSHILYGSTDSDNTPEFSILLSAVSSVAASDFIL